MQICKHIVEVNWDVRRNLSVRQSSINYFEIARRKIFEVANNYMKR